MHSAALLTHTVTTEKLTNFQGQIVINKNTFNNGCAICIEMCSDIHMLTHGECTEI